VYFRSGLLEIASFLFHSGAQGMFAVSPLRGRKLAHVRGNFDERRSPAKLALRAILLIVYPTAPIRPFVFMEHAHQGCW
jgi:hypothetical protein